MTTIAQPSHQLQPPDRTNGSLEQLRLYGRDVLRVALQPGERTDSVVSQAPKMTIGDGDGRRPAGQESEPARYHAAGTPAAWQSAVLNCCEGGFVARELIVEAARRNLIDPARFTIPQMEDASHKSGRPASRNAIYRGLKALEQSGFVAEFPTDALRGAKNVGKPATNYELLPLTVQHQAILGLSGPIIHQRSFPIKPDEYGNPPIVGQLTGQVLSTLDLEAFADDVAAFDKHHELMLDPPARQKAGKRARIANERLKDGLDDLTIIPLAEGFTLNSLHNYRLALLRAWVEEGRLCSKSKRKIAEALGISSRSVNEYLRDAGIEIDRGPDGDGHFERGELTSAEDIPGQVKTLNYEIRGHPRRIVAETPQGEWAIPYSAGEEAQAFVAHHRRAGNRVEVEFQIANKHTVGQVPPQLEREATRRQERQESEGVGTAERTTKPGESHKPGSHFRRWLVGQLRLRLEKTTLDVPSPSLGRVIRFHQGCSVDVETGEILDAEPTPQEMLTVIVAAVDPLVAMAMELGGVIGGAAWQT